MKRRVVLLLSIILILIGSIFIKYKLQDNPERVISKYYQYINDKDYDKLNGLMFKALDGEKVFDGVKKIELLEMCEEKDYQIDKYKNKDFYSTKVFRVNYYISFKENVKSSIDDGNHPIFIWVVKEEQSSKWKIKDIGF